MGHGGNQDFPECRVLQCLRGIVDEIHDHTAEQPFVGAHRRQILGKSCLERDAIEPPGEYFHRLMNDDVGIRGHKFGDREAHELRELVDQSGERGDLPLDQTRALLNQLGQFRVTSSR